MRAHKLSNHAGPEQTKRDVRTEYWIVGGKRKVTSVLKTCKNKECRTPHLRAINHQSPSLPEQRMDTAHCFEAISVDAFGPLEMKICATCHQNALCIKCQKKEEKASDSKSKECKYKKVYVMLFADMVSRAVDLQPVRIL